MACISVLWSQPGLLRHINQIIISFLIVLLMDLFNMHFTMAPFQFMCFHSLQVFATIVTLALLGPLIQSLTQSLLFRFLIHIVQFLGFGIWIPGFSFKIWNCLDVVLRFYDSCFWIHGVKFFIIPFLEILFRYYLVKQCESRCLDGSIPGCWLFTGGSPGMSQ